MPSIDMHPEDCRANGRGNHQLLIRFVVIVEELIAGVIGLNLILRRQGLVRLHIAVHVELLLHGFHDRLCKLLGVVPGQSSHSRTPHTGLMSMPGMDSQTFTSMKTRSQNLNRGEHSRWFPMKKPLRAAKIEAAHVKYRQANSRVTAKCLKRRKLPGHTITRILNREVVALLKLLQSHLDRETC